MSSVQPSAQPLRISLRGKTLCPVVHFETTFSSYRHNPDVPGPFGRFGPLEADVKTLEFQSKGIRIRNTKRFYVFNPTNTSWEFFLENEDADSTGASSSSSAPSPVFRVCAYFVSWMVPWRCSSCLHSSPWPLPFFFLHSSRCFAICRPRRLMVSCPAERSLKSLSSTLQIPWM